MKKLFVGLLCAAMVLSTMSGCAGSTSTASGTTKAAGDAPATLTYMIWDTNQQAGMKAIADQFTKENPNIKVNVQVTPWDQYWTKLEASAKGGAMPDVFWMHADDIDEFVSGNTLMDLTDRVKGSTQVSMDNFPKAVVETSKVGDKIYGIPKDYGDLALWYNKTMFDVAGIKYPDDTWTWDTLLDAAKKLTDPSKGQYGFLAKEDGQNLFYNFIWQNGGTIIADDKKSAGYDKPEAKEAIQYLVNFVTSGYSPTQSQFSNTSAEQYMESGKGAMGLFGSWEVTEFEGNDYMKKNCDLAVLPKGKVRATDLNGLGNSVAANTKYPEQAWKFVEYMGTKEAMEIQGKSGAAIPAYKGTEQSWVDSDKDFNFKAYIDEADYGMPSPETPSKPTWSKFEQDIMTKVFSGQLAVNDGCDQLAQKINETIAAESK